MHILLESKLHILKIGLFQVHDSRYDFPKIWKSHGISRGFKPQTIVNLTARSFKYWHGSITLSRGILWGALAQQHVNTGMSNMLRQSRLSCCVEGKLVVCSLEWFHRHNSLWMEQPHTSLPLELYELLRELVAVPWRCVFFCDWFNGHSSFRLTDTAGQSHDQLLGHSLLDTWGLISLVGL